MDESNTSTISPMGYLRILFRQKWFIILPTFAGLIIGICSGMLLPKKYQSSTVILVEEGKTDNPLFSQIAVSTTVGQRMAAIKESMLGWNSLVKLVKRLNLDANVKNKQEFENLILGLRKDTLIRLRSHNIIDLAHLGKDPEQTQAIVKSITEIFIEKNVEAQNQETSDAIKFIEEQLKVYRGKIKSAEIAELQDHLDTLLIDSTEEHPMVKKFREQIAAKKADLEKENLEFTEDIVLDKETTNPIIEEIRKALDNVQGKTPTDVASSIGRGTGAGQDIYKVMLIDKLDNVMARDVKVNESIYNMLLQRIETAKITQRLQSSKEGTRYTIIDPPRVPFKPTKPNRPLVALVGLFFGTAIGVGLVFAREFLDKSFLDVQDAKNFFGQPLLGAISCITTTEDISMKKEKDRWIVGITLLAGVLAIVVSAFVESFTK